MFKYNETRCFQRLNISPSEVEYFVKSEIDLFFLANKFEVDLSKNTVEITDGIFKEYNIKFSKSVNPKSVNDFVKKILNNGESCNRAEMQENQSEIDDQFRDEIVQIIESLKNANSNSNSNTNVNSNLNTTANDNKKSNKASSNVVVSNSPTQLTTITTIEEIQKPNQTDYAGLIFPVLAAILAITIALILSKNLFNKWKYGKNALNNLGSLKKAICVKNELTNKWLKKRRSANIHAIGVGKIDETDDYCIQVFVDDANAEMLENPPTQLLPKEYQDFPIVIFEMPRAEFLGLLGNHDSKFTADNARQSHSILRGGISSANANLTSEFGTIGYFFKPNFVNQAVSLWLKKHLYLLSNSHVFSDLSKTECDKSDMILHPSPGESAASKSVAQLYKSVPILFGGDVENPNYVDASIAKLHSEQEYIQEIPRIGKIVDFLKKEQVELRSVCHKFGRTTGYTQGKIFSIHLSIWVKYAAGAKEALFKDQFLIIPTDGSSFVKSGDSGSLVADFENKAIGLIFAGAEKRTSLQFENIDEALELESLASSSTQIIENYGVANSISDILSAFNIKIDV